MESKLCQEESDGENGIINTCQNNNKEERLAEHRKQLQVLKPDSNVFEYEGENPIISYSNPISTDNQNLPYTDLKPGLNKSPDGKLDIVYIGKIKHKILQVDGKLYIIEDRIANQEQNDSFELDDSRNRDAVVPFAPPFKPSVSIELPEYTSNFYSDNEMNTNPNF